MSKRTFHIIGGIMAVVLGVLIGLNIWQDSRKTWDECYWMTNRRIEWTGAGYSGIYEK